MKALKWIWGLVTENLGWKVAALAIAFLIWVLVASEPELSTFATVRVEYKNLPGDLEFSSEPATTIALELRGPSGALRGAGENVRPAVILDMSGVQPGERTFPIGDGNVKLARGVRMVRSIPSEVRFDFERRVARRVPVTVRFIGEGRSGYRVARAEKSPAELEIVGPASHVAGVSTAVTDPVDVSALTGAAEFHVNAFVEDPYVRFAGPPAVSVTITMKKK